MGERTEQTDEVSGVSTVTDTPIGDLRISGRVVTPADRGYGAARHVWNGMIDRRPLAVAQTADVDDVVTVVRYAREHGLPLAVRGGGHVVSGNGTVDGGIILDLGAMYAVDVDAAARTVRVDGGAALADLDGATAPHGLAVPAGVVSTTGVGGLALGGGVGWLTRAHGLTADNLLEAEVVTAAGERVRASATENPELLWGLKGGGGNFGVVTSFTFAAYPIPTPLVATTLLYGQDRWRDTLAAWEMWTRDLPDAMQSIFTVAVPPPVLGAGDDPLIILGAMWSDPEDTETADRLLAELRSQAPPDAEEPESDWLRWQSAFDAAMPAGSRAYWKNTSFDRMDDDVLDVLLRRATEQRWVGTAFDVHHMGGASARVAPDATAFPHRGSRFWLNVYGFWTNPDDDDARTAFVRGFAADMAPFSTGGQYVNFMGHEKVTDWRARALEVYGEEKMARLVALKREYDPGNLFRLNHNIPPD